MPETFRGREAVVSRNPLDPALPKAPDSLRNAGACGLFDPLNRHLTEDGKFVPERFDMLPAGSLNPEQQEAVEAVEPAVAVIAGPGTGSTGI